MLFNLLLGMIFMNDLFYGKNVFVVGGSFGIGVVIVMVFV